MFYVRAITAIVFGAVGLVPLVLAGACWWVALKVSPLGGYTARADAIRDALRRVWPGRRPGPVASAPPQTVQVPTAAPPLPPISDARLAAIADQADRTVVRLDGQRAMFGPLAERVRH